MSPNLLKVISRSFIFGLGAIAVLALLPLVARDLIRGSAINNDGRSSSLTAPNGIAQEAVIRAALRDAERELLADVADRLREAGSP